jgi:hypothetical protein
MVTKTVLLVSTDKDFGRRVVDYLHTFGVSAEYLCSCNMPPSAEEFDLVLMDNGAVICDERHCAKKSLTNEFKVLETLGVVDPK